MRLLFIFFLFCFQGLYSQAQRSFNQPKAIWPLKDEKENLKNQNGIIYQCWLQNDTLLFSKSNLKQAIKLNKIYLYDDLPQKLSLQIICDTSKTKFNKRIYISWADQKNGKNNWDIFLIYSDDEGEHWIEPILVSYHPNHKSQYSPNININQSNGDLFLCYFDQQNYLNEDGRDIYLAKSKNGGQQFEYIKLNTEKLKQDSLTKNVLLFESKGNRFFWRNITSLQQVLNSEVLNDLEPFAAAPLLNEVEISHSFLFTEKLLINFTCQSKMKIAFAITKPIDPGFGTVKVSNKKFKKGNNHLLMDMNMLNIKKGNYVLTLYYKNINKYIWITED